MIVHDSEIISIRLKTSRKINFLIFEIKNNYSEKISDEILEKIIKDLSDAYVDFYKNKIIFAQIYKLDKLSSSNIYNEMKFLYKYIDFLKTFNYMFQECNIGTSLIINSSFIKNVINLLLNFYENVKPIKCFEHEINAQEWIDELNKTNN